MLRPVCASRAFALILRGKRVLASATDKTLQLQFSGYGSTVDVVAASLARIQLRKSLEDWDDQDLHNVVDAFMDERFPTCYVRNLFFCLMQGDTPLLVRSRIHLTAD